MSEAMDQGMEMPQDPQDMADGDIPDDYGDAYDGDAGFDADEHPTDQDPPVGMPEPGSPDKKTKGSTMAENTQSTMAATHEGFDRPSDWPFSHRPVQPAHAQEWQDNTLQRLQLAKALTRDAQFQFSKNDRAGTDSARRHEDAHTNVHQRLKTKINQTQDIATALQERVDSMEDTTRQTGECLFQMQRAHRSKWAPLNVCERRLELRDGRPLQELVRDHFQEALEHERQTLIEARQELADQIQGTKEMLSSLEAMKQECIEDMQHKRHAMRIDRSCLNPDKPHGKEPDRFFLPALPEVVNYTLPPSPKDTAHGTGVQHEQSRQGGARTLISRAVRLEENAMRLCNENDAAMLHCKRECSRANAATCVAMDRRTQDVAKLKTQLEGAIQETDATIAEAERSLQKTKKKLDAHEAPLRCLNKQFSLRDRRTDREHIRDPVTDDMESHLDAVKKSVSVLTKKWQSTKNILDHLKASKQQMVEDLKCKTIAWKIDDSCRKVTPKKAIELDRMDPRGGRCHPDAKKGPSGRFQAILDDEFA
jgi:hypothetical protein